MKFVKNADRNLSELKKKTNVINFISKKLNSGARDMKGVYMDHAAATPVPKAVIEAMLPYFDQCFGNPSTVYEMGSQIKQTIEEQREKVATLIGAQADEIGFSCPGRTARDCPRFGRVNHG